MKPQTTRYNVSMQVREILLVITILEDLKDRSNDDVTELLFTLRHTLARLPKEVS